jgi:peptidoglycan/LPS O-acetylase OafA/YrhL
VSDGAVVVQAGERRLARLESLRALAALGVVAGHAWGFAHGFGNGVLASFGSRLIYGGGYGVFLFFALTGYLLYWPFVVRYFGDGAAVDLGVYARNRVLRILPLYFIAVIVLLVLQDGDPAWWRVLTLTQNFSEETVARKVDGPLWSVVVEVHFYILLPLLAAAVAAVAGRSLARAAGVLAVLGLIGFAVHQAKTPDSSVWRYNLPTTFMFFVPGMLLALARLELERRPPEWLRTLAGRSAAWLIVALLLWLYVVDQFDVDWLAAVASFFTVGACVLPLRESGLRRALDWRPLAALGVASYSLYVWHMPIQFSLAVHQNNSKALMAATVPLAIVVALISYRVIEAPFLRLRRRWSSATAPAKP